MAREAPSVAEREPSLGYSMEKPHGRSITALAAAMRPRQWIKNLLLFAGVVFTGSLGKPMPMAAAAAAFGVFCLLSSGVYLINDVLDVERDRLHPKKRLRPIASGRVSPRTALAAAGVLWLLAIGMTAGLYLTTFGPKMLGWKFMALAGLYLALQIGYTTTLKRQPILDVCIIASGFVLRAMAGAAAIGVSISPWLIVCTGLLSLLIGFGKRRHEVLLLGEGRSGHRQALGQYSVGMIDQFLTISTAGTIVTYAIYTIDSPTAHSYPRLYWTIPPVVYAVFRYLFVLQQGDKGGAPERDLLEDRHILVSIVLWIVLAALALKLPQFNVSK